MAAVAEICRRVDGLPLAIELAAARCGLLSPVEIAQRLDTALGVAGAGARDAPARQQTLRATIDWSHDLLSADERACFARCAVFAGGATVEAAEAVTGAGLETLDRLVAKSLLVRRGSPDVRTRLTMLETVRAYAGERFAAAPDAGAIHERHYQHFLALAQQHGSERALFGTSAKQHLARLDPEIENLHAALGWAVSQRDAESALALCATLGWYWLMRDRYAEALGWIDRALSLPGADAHPALRARVLCFKCGTLWPLGRKRELPAVARQAEAIARTVADPMVRCEVLYTCARFEGGAGRPDLAGTLADEALHLAREAGDDWAAGMAASSRTIAAHSAAELRERVDLAAGLLEGVGNVYELAYRLADASYTALRMGSDRDASDFVRRATPVARKLDSPYLWMFLRGNVGLTALLTGDADAARNAFEEELQLCRALVTPPFMSEGVGGLGAVAAACGDLDRAARLSGAASAHRFGQQDDAVDARLHETYFQPARSRHGPDAWDAASREGAAMSFDDAIAYALNEPNG
jgi:tetratricopeptide (TPR) repeat protein